MQDKILTSLQELLNDVHDSYRHHQQLIRASGENFNVFNVLKLSRKEVRLHSTFIAELLNVRGSHGKGDFFLQAFIKHIRTTNEQLANVLGHFNTTHSVTHMEYGIGFISSDGTRGGRIDILLQDDKYSIIIENKIDAGDADNQLVRYSAIKNQIVIIYLTLNGRDPDVKSVGNLKKNIDYICMSYKKDIISWLEISIEQSTLPAHIDSSIRQYIHLAKLLSNTNKSDVMNTSILEILTKNDTNIETSYHIAAYWEKIVKLRGDAIFESFTKTLGEKHFQYDTYEKWRSFPRIDLHIKGWNNHLIGFTEEGGLFYGIKRINRDIQPIEFNQIATEISSDYKSSDWWLCYSRTENSRFHPKSFNPYLKENEALLVSFLVNKTVELYKIYEACKDNVAGW